MCRDTARTVSLTAIELAATTATMTYHGDAPDRDGPDRIERLDLRPAVRA